MGRRRSTYAKYALYIINSTKDIGDTGRQVVTQLDYKSLQFGRIFVAYSRCLAKQGASHKARQRVTTNSSSQPNASPKTKRLVKVGNQWSDTEMVFNMKVIYAPRTLLCMCVVAVGDAIVGVWWMKIKPFFFYKMKTTSQLKTQMNYWLLSEYK